MKFYYDTEFLEGTQTKRFLGIPFGKTKPTIDLISIGIIDDTPEPNSLDLDAEIAHGIPYKRPREYYAISKDFNLKEAWNRYDLKDDFSVGARIGALPPKKKVYWIRDNVLKPIFEELSQKSIYDQEFVDNHLYTLGTGFTFHHLETLINFYGKSNKQIAQEVIEFVYGFAVTGYPEENTNKIIPKDIKFYAYYGAYDHVALCWLFGKMMNLPKGFPMYSVDLKQMLDESIEKKTNKDFNEGSVHIRRDGFSIVIPEMTLDEKLKRIKEHAYYPKQSNEHNALDDARWNKKLHKFISNL